MITTTDPILCINAPAIGSKRPKIANIIAIILRGDKDENALANPHNAILVGKMIQEGSF